MAELITIKVIHKEKYSELNLTVVEDPRLDWATKGLHTYLITRPPGWIIWQSDLLNRATNGKDSLIRAKKQLIKYGYLEIEKVRGEKGRFRYIWYLREVSLPVPDKPVPVKPCVEKQKQEKQTHSITINTNNHVTTTQCVVVDFEVKQEEYNENTVNLPITSNALHSLAVAHNIPVHIILYLGDILNHQIQEGMPVKEGYHQLLYGMCRIFNKNPRAIIRPYNYLSPWQRAAQEEKKQLKQKQIQERAKADEKIDSRNIAKFDALSPVEQDSWMNEAKKYAPFVENKAVMKMVAIKIFMEHINGS